MALLSIAPPSHYYFSLTLVLVVNDSLTFFIAFCFHIKATKTCNLNPKRLTFLAGGKFAIVVFVCLFFSFQLLYLRTKHGCNGAENMTWQVIYVFPFTN